MKTIVLWITMMILWVGTSTAQVADATLPQGRFVSAHASLNDVDEAQHSGAELTVEWAAQGLEPDTAVQYTLFSYLTALWRCMDVEGHCVVGARTYGTHSPQSQDAVTFISTADGTVQGRLQLEYPYFDRVCDAGQHIETVSITFSSLRLTDDTHGVEAALPESLSAVFKSCEP